MATDALTGHCGLHGLSSPRRRVGGASLNQNHWIHQRSSGLRRLRRPRSEDMTTEDHQEYDSFPHDSLPW